VRAPSRCGALIAGTAYLWSNVTFTPLYGRLSDLLGRRTAYLQALVLFTVGTALCGIAPTFGFLTVSRFLAGMGGGGMGTVASVLVADLFPPADRGFYQGLSFAVFGAGMGLGGPIGGALTQAFGWRAAFYGVLERLSSVRTSAGADRILIRLFPTAQLPVAAIALVLVVLAVPTGAGAPMSWKRLGQVDFGGSLTLLLSVSGALIRAYVLY
jgi:MFS family permease